MESRADLHVHSRHSNRPSEWFLRRIGAPESFTKPRVVYERAKAQGMDFVTISDHNCIRGAQEIAHLPGTFISNEVTTYFPEDGCKIHCLVFGIDESQFEDIEKVRPNIYEFRDYLLDQDIAHSVAHPLFSVNGRLGLEHVEKLLVLFKRFEGINGSRDPRASILVRAILDNLNGAMVMEMADRHGLDPRDPVPWRKWVTAGSDDHGGLYIASAYTATPKAANVKEFLGYLRRGEHQGAGRFGSSLKLARSFYTIAYEYYRDRLMRGDESRHDLFSEMFSRILHQEPGEGRGRRMWSVSSLFARLRRPRLSDMGRIDRVVANELAKLAAITDGDRTSSLEQRCFRIASQLSQQLSYAAVRRFAKYLGQGSLTESLETASSLGPVALCIAPYIAAFQTQHKDEALLQKVARHFPATLLLEKVSSRRAWFTDTFGDVNGVAVTVRTCARLAGEQRRDLVVITSVDDPQVEGANVKNFEPVGWFPIPEYSQQRLSFPPFLEILEYCEREKVSEIIISTPGPMGLIGIAAAKLLGLRLRGIYHTDFPQYVRYLTDSPSLESLTTSYMRWFFEQMDQVYAPSGAYLDRLIQAGITPSKIRLLPRGVDLGLFNAEKRDKSFWTSVGVPSEGFKFLYVGRVSKEKNLDAMIDAFLQLVRDGYEVQLVVVGDGPHLPELHRRYGDAGIFFTGFLLGEALAKAYASAEVFVFPSTTDTFGNAVLEAQASGLPAIVTDGGGAQEVILQEVSGLVAAGGTKEALGEAMVRLYREHTLRVSMRREAVRNARTSRWEDLLDELLPPAEAGVEGQETLLGDLPPGPRSWRDAAREERVSA